VQSAWASGVLTKGTKPIPCFVVMMLWPGYFAWLAYGFAALCLVKTLTCIAVMTLPDNQGSRG